MASLNQLVYNIRNLPYGGFTSDDTNVSDEQIAFIINYLRAKGLKEGIESKRIRQLEPFTQSLGAVSFSLVDKSECVEIDSDCDILRTTTKLPTPLYVNNSVAITAVQTVDGSFSFSKTYLAASKWQRFNKWTPHTRKWYYKEGHLYITNDEEIEAVEIIGAWSDPRSAGEYKNCPGGVCWTPDSDYPLPDWMIKDITDTILRGEAASLMVGVSDTKNDAKDGKGTNGQER
jgi:hypothetical protein